MDVVRTGARRKTSVVVVALGLGVATSLALSSCSLIPHLGSGGPVSGSSGTSSDDGGSTTGGSGSSSDGGATAGDTGVLAGKPSTFPADIPVIDGPIPFGLDLGTGWTVIVTVSDLTTGYSAASDKLKAAGFTADMESIQTEGALGIFTNGTYRIQLTAASTADYGPSLSYVVVLVG